MAERPDLLPVISADEDIDRGMSPGKLAVLESTVYPGVTEEVLKPVLEQSGLVAGEDFGLAHCPERFNPGDTDHTIADIKFILKKAGHIVKDDFIINIASIPLSEKGKTNMIKLTQVE